MTEVTETQATSLQSEASATVGVSTPLKAETGTKLQSTESSGSQVLRKAIIQTTFGQLRASAVRTGALRLNAEQELVSVGSLEELVRLGQSEAGHSLVVPPARLQRGDLIEVDVQLEAEPIFQAGMAVSGVLDIVQDDPEAFGLADAGQLAQLRLVSRMLDKVLAGLVPVRGRAVDFEAVRIAGEEWMVHTSLLAGLQEKLAGLPIYAVGVAQEGLFWKDVRRVLFSDSQYRVLARLNCAGLQSSWTPVKLVDVLSSVVPDFADVMDTLNRDVLSTMAGAVATQQESSVDRQERAMVSIYATLLADRAGVQISDDALEAEGFLEPSGAQQPGVREWRQLLQPVTAFIEQQAGEAFDRETAADYRVAAATQAGLLDSSAPTHVAERGTATDSERFLDAEIVAVYW